MRKQYHGWIVVEEAGPGFKDYIFVEFYEDKERQRKQMEARGQSGCVEAIEWWDRRLRQPVKLEATLKGMYRVYTEAS